jgi:hypothetical protein
MSRALRYDGLLAYTTRGAVTPEDIRAMRAYVEEYKEADGTFDIVWEGVTPGDDPERAVSMVLPLAEAGRDVVDRVLVVAAQRARRSAPPYRAGAAAHRALKRRDLPAG